MKALSGFRPLRIAQVLPKHIKIYVVGGAVRDQLMGIQSADRDWVVVGATADDMKKAGFTPVGANFPVFLHPKTHEEFALARTERKQGKGYKGFTFFADPTVTLEQDLERRDLTINAMAMSSSGELIDPYNGHQDLQARLLRHVSPAFAEDPLRVLRTARFLSRFKGFVVADETVKLCQQLVSSGEMAHLVAERVFAELNKVMNCALPGKAWQFLAQLEVWASMLPAVAQAWGNVSQADETTLSKTISNSAMRWAWWLNKTKTQEEIVHCCACLRAPKEIKDYALLWFKLNAFSAVVNDKKNILENGLYLLTSVDVFRKPDRFVDVLKAWLVVQNDETGQLVKTTLVPIIKSIQQGEFKLGLRQFIQDNADMLPAKAAETYRKQWLEKKLVK